MFRSKYTKKPEITERLQVASLPGTNDVNAAQAFAEGKAQRACASESENHWTATAYKRTMELN